MSRRDLQFSPTHAYWAVVIALAVCTLFFVGNVQWRRGQLRTEEVVQIDSGTEVEVVRVIDSDEISVKPAEGGTFVVRMLGVKGFPTATNNEPGLSGLGAGAVQALEQAVRDQTVVVVFDEFKTDRTGRLLAYLEIEGKDVGEMLVRRGYVVTYTAHEFSREEIYLRAEREARGRKAGLWFNGKAVSRVQGWKDSWRSAREG